MEATKINHIACAIAKQNGFDTVKRIKSWNNFIVFIADFSGKEIPCVGYPSFILIDKSNKGRLATSKETFEIMGMKFISNGKH